MKYFLMIFIFSLWSSLSADPQSDAQAVYNQQYETQRVENARQTQAIYNQQYENQRLENQRQARKQDDARYEARRLANSRR